jgi:type VI protein secretion system component VasK
MIEQFKQMPKGMQIAMMAMGAISLLGVAAMIDRSAIIIVIIGLILVALAVFVWHLFMKWKAGKQARALRGRLSESSTSSLSSISAPARRAKLDDLRQNFGKGMEKFRAAGKDIYSLPWYVVCGEPGSGKSEAIRHCNVGFPPGLQNEMQGVGGTLNMHWWFTNQAVLLDTAGKLLFEEAPPGSTTEWSEFLNLLKKARPNCPVNGLLLVIPSESLIRDSFEEIQRKAGKIAQQLDVIQKNLDVRFPVFILITMRSD